jgi:tetratricopeptide (TPR) repeat protein
MWQSPDAGKYVKLHLGVKMKATLRYLNKPIVHVVLIAVLGLIVYSNTFEVPFQFDDGGNITDNARIKDLANITGFFTVERSGPFASRPLLHATTALNYYFGGLDTRGYHAVNLALHLINGVLLYLLVSLTGRRLRFEESSLRTAAALSALVFVVHPVQTEAVTYIVSRSMLLSTMFYFLGIILFFKASTSKKRKVLYCAGLLAVSFLGMASRENFVTFPLMLFLYDLFFLSGFSAKDALKRHYKLYLPVVLSLGYFAFIVLSNTYDRSADYPGIGVRPHDYVITQFGAHWTYLRLLVFPSGQNADYDYPISRTLFELPALISFAGYLGLWAGTFLLARKRPAVAFGALWFLVTLVPISFAVAFMGLRLGNVIFEHRAYLPSAGAISAVAWGVAILTERNDKLRTAAVSVIVGLSLVLSAAAYKRNEVWRSDVSLWEDVVKKSPEKDRGHYNLGLAYQNRKMLGEAIEQYEAAIKIRPGSSGPHELGITIKDSSHYNLGSVYQEKGLLEKAIEHYENAIKINPDHAKAHNNLGMLYRKQGRNDKAIEYYETAVRLDPANAEMHNNIGNAYDIGGQTDKAIKHYQEAIRLKPNYAVAHYNLAIAYMNKGLTDLAIEQYRQAVEKRPDFLEAHFSLGRIYLDRGQEDVARKHLENVLRINPNHYGARQLLHEMRNAD